ncbi:trypsin-like serine peptidase [Jannaschia pohangensis]|uniref:V8-like Glu-specific endopeptidase n=1 Tax=Jannaschia pohangensis TaxID=390807 RepID=A0A1I3MV27_9RHOB|nr:trypsin-like serine protease [Jannaschia pohangensis]SFJ00837.1 V8-like Glu-specific endopeptidase [Jannaschia pohangensis]
MRQILATVALCLLAVPAIAAGDGPQSLNTADEVRGLEGVGRLDMLTTSGQSGFCTATLVSPTLVLTAAHCVFDPATGAAHRTEEIVFRAGLRHGREDARRTIRRMVVHPGYDFSAKPSAESVAADLALLELDRALQMPNVQPFPASGRLREGDVVQVVSYARDRADAPSSEDDCTVLHRNLRVLALDCSVNFGASGAPVFVNTTDGLRIVSVISAMGEIDGEPAAFAVTVEAGLATLMQEFGRSSRLTATRKTIRVGESASGNIRFVRPGE